MAQQEADATNGEKRPGRSPRTRDAELDLYCKHLLSLGAGLGEVTPESGETVNDVRTLIRVAAWSLGVRCRTWVDGGRVYVYVLHQRHSA